MAKLPADVQELFNTAPSMVLCTADAQGQPNGAPIGRRKVIDEETVYISDQFFNKTLANLQENAQVAVAFWGETGAYQIHGTARYLNDGEEFAPLKQWADEAFAAAGMPIVAKGGCFIHVNALYTSTPGPNAGAQLA